MLEIIVNGSKLDGFKNLIVRKSLRSAASEFMFTTSGGKRFSPIQIQDSVEVIADGTRILDGFIERISVGTTVTESGGSHDIIFRGRDRIGDFIDSTLGGSEFEFNSPISLAQVTSQVISRLGITGVLVNNPRNPIEPFGADELVKPDIGQKAVDFVEQYCRKRQVLLTNDGLGNILFYNGPLEQIDSALVNEIGSQNNNIISSDFELDYTNRFNNYIARSEGNLVGLSDVLPDDFASEPSELASTDSNNIEGSAVDAEIRASRRFNFIAENASDVENATNRAIWQANINRASSKKYTATVQGHSYNRILNRQPWLIGRTVRVVDQFASVNSTLLISDVQYTMSLDEGSQTKMLLVAQDAYTLNAEEPRDAGQLGARWTEEDLRETVENARRTVREATQGAQ